MHLAEAAGAQTVALFRTTSPAQYGPRRPGSVSVDANDASPEKVAALIGTRLPKSAGA
jgi:ADP-heptose:LPS heptosyltransferase